MCDVINEEDMLEAGVDTAVVESVPVIDNVEDVSEDALNELSNGRGEE